MLAWEKEGGIKMTSSGSGKRLSTETEWKKRGLFRGEHFFESRTQGMWGEFAKTQVWMSSQVALVVKNLSANAGDLRDMGLIPGSGRSPGGEGMATHSSILAERISWTEEPGRLQPIGSQSWTQLKQLNMYAWMFYGSCRFEVQEQVWAEI